LYRFVNISTNQQFHYISANIDHCLVLSARQKKAIYPFILGLLQHESTDIPAVAFPLPIVILPACTVQLPHGDAILFAVVSGFLLLQCSGQYLQAALREVPQVRIQYFHAMKPKPPGWQLV
jgi:hypothetical protein